MRAPLLNLELARRIESAELAATPLQRRNS
jgi:hypothetical protein